MPYPRDHSDLPASPRLPEVEKDILDFWKSDDTFRASVEQREGAPEWVFYDGPPFANGLPHYGHLLTGYAKDVFPRFQTMRGKQVKRVFGWDTHGLPAELEAERQLGIDGKADIERMGLAAFNKAAKASVLRYTEEWKAYVTRQARWVDFEGGYKTLDLSYMESVIWAFKQLYDKGLAYEGYRVLPYCWHDETPLSNHELRMDDDVYQPRQDQTVTVTFPLTGVEAQALGLAGVKALAWTTTPWTLPTNAALAVGPDIDYVVVPAGSAGAADGQKIGVTGERQTSVTDSLQPGDHDKQQPLQQQTQQPDRYLLAAALLSSYASELGYESAEAAEAAVERHISGRELEGVHYERLWDFYANDPAWAENAWRILVADYVTVSDGTGIVHQAPAYGEDDQRVCEAAGIPIIVSVDDGGRFLPIIAPVAGMQVFEANMPLIRLLRRSRRLFKEASYVHSYPHCWRCRTPLIYKAVSSWFVRVTDIKERMIELNEQITWVPENVKHGQFGKWLEGARDWSVSRNRFFGSPIPVWKSDDPSYPRIDVYGSLAELERDFGALPRNDEGEIDLHRPWVDGLTRPNPDDPSGKATMRRISDVFDVWFDSGSMPFAQVHYPFDNREWFDTHNPANYIVEYIGQTRGWFYVQHVLGTALFDRPAFLSCISHGIVLGSDGQKMSKSLRNYPDVAEVFDRDGSDAMRWFLMSSSVLRGGSLIVTEEGIRQGVREVLLPLWSTWYFFSLYANACGYEARRSTASTNELDRYLLAKTHDLITALTTDYEALDAPMAAAKLRDFADVLTNWYVRRSRDRFWEGVGDDGRNAEAFDTLYTVLETVLRVAAPLLPLVTERIWRGLTGERSVHLSNWPDAGEFPRDPGLVARMDRVRQVTSTVLSLRKTAKIRVRQPLALVTVVAEDAASLAPFVDILREELNVKKVELVPASPGIAAQYGITRRLSVNARAAGPRLGGAVQQAIKAARAGDWSDSGGQVTAGGIPLEPGEYELVLETTQSGDSSTVLALLPLADTETPAATAGSDGSDGSGTSTPIVEGFVLLETHLTPELETEGVARDLIRSIQEARKEAGLDVSDRIALSIAADETTRAAAQAHHDLICAETLALTLELTPLEDSGAPETAGPATPATSTATGPGSHDTPIITVAKVNA